MVGLYEEPEKPDAPLDYLKHFISGANDIDIAALTAENEELKKRINVLETKLEESAVQIKKANQKIAELQQVDQPMQEDEVQEAVSVRLRWVLLL